MGALFNQSQRYSVRMVVIRESFCMKSITFWILIVGLLWSLFGCEQEYRKETVSPEEIEQQVRYEKIQEDETRKQGGGFSRTFSSDDAPNRLRRPPLEQKTTASSSTKSKKTRTIHDLESSVENEVRVEPARQKEEVIEIIPDKTELAKKDPPADPFTKTKRMNPNLYVPEEDNVRVRNYNEHVSTAEKYRGAAPATTITEDGIIIAHPRRTYPPSRHVLLWSEEHGNLQLAQKASKTKEFGPYSRFKFYQEFGLPRWNFDWVDVSQEMNELPTTLESWKRSETSWKPTDKSGERWDYGQSWAYEEDKFLKLVLVKSPDYWSETGDAKLFSVAYCLLKFDENKTTLYYTIRTERVDPAVSFITLEKSSPFDFERFFEHLEKTFSAKNSNASVK